MHEANLESAAGAKICIYCGQDCSDRPRVRDPRNRYACRECAEHASKDWSRQGPLAATADPDLVFDVEPAPADTAEPLRCAVCLKQIVTGSSICTRCNYDPAVGLTEDTLVGRARLGAEGLQCVNCDYSLRGLKVMRCPECGEHIRPRLSGDRKAGRFKDEATREAYRTPLLMLGVSMAVLLPWMAVMNGPLAAGVFVMVFGLSVLLALGGLFICSVLWMGFDAPWHLSALRIAGIFAAMDLTDYAIDSLAGGFFVLDLISFVIFLRVFAEIMDMTWTDVLGLWVVLIVINMGIRLAIFSAGW